MAETWRAGPGGILELVNEKGEIIAVEKKRYVHREPDGSVVVKKHRGRPSQQETQTHHFVRDNRNRKIWVPKGTNPDDLPALVYPFSQVTWDLVCDHIRRGKTMIEIGKMEGMPPEDVLYKWKNKREDFKVQYLQARADSATHFAELAIEEAKFAKERTVQSDRLRTDTYKWAAEVRDRDTYGRTTKITGDPNAPIGFIVDTGIRREEHKVPQPDPLAENPALPKPKGEDP